MDPDYIKSMSIKPHDQTSNQLWLHIQLSNPTSKELLESVVKYWEMKAGKLYIREWYVNIYFYPDQLLKDSRLPYSVKGILTSFVVEC